MKKSIKATVLIYTLVLINLALIMAFVVFNNVSVLFTNSEIQRIQKKLSSNILYKWNLSIKYNKTLNSNWTWFIDNISCPTNITMSWTNSSSTGIPSNLVYSSWSFFCSWIYNSKEFKIFFSEDFTWFSWATYESSLITLNSWVWNTTFLDTDNTLMSFSTASLSGVDNIDDDFNSDNYLVTSTWITSTWTYYPDNFEDDDVLARKLIYSYINPNSWFVNIFWSNSKLAEYVNNNSNNNDNINTKIWSTWTWYLYLDLDWDFSLKLVKFNKVYYDTTTELIPLETLQTNNIWASIGYIKNNSWTLSLGDVKDGSEYVFDFISNDYAIFVSNTWTWTLFSKLIWEADSWSWIYLNPIDDSGDNLIRFLWNDIIIDDEGRYIADQFEVVWSK